MRVSKDERDRIDVLARACALSIGTTCAVLPSTARSSQPVPAINYHCIQELVRVGRNLNQALVAMYTRGASSELLPTLLELLALLEGLRSTLTGQKPNRGEAAS